MKPFDIQAFIDRQQFSRPHATVAALAMAAMFIDGFDIFMLGKIAPAIAKGLDVSPASMTVVFMMQQVGLAVGSFAMSPLSDLFGRKRLLVVSFVVFGLLTVATAFVDTIMQLAVLRLVAGLFLAGVVPTVLALVSEFTPKRHRSTVTGLAMAGYSVGNAAGASVAFLIPLYGWQAAFWVAGLMPLALAPLLAFLLYESLAYQASRDPRDPAIAKTLTRIDPQVDLTGDESFELHAGATRKARVLDILNRRRAPLTILIWACCVLSMGNIAMLAAWLPTFFQEMAGIPIQRFAVALIVSMVGGLIGMSTIGFMMDRLKPVWVVAGCYVGNACALLVLGRLPFDNPLFMPLLATFAFCQACGQGGLNILMTQVYPPAMRSTGIGWAGGAGRIGGVFAPAFGGYALASSLTLDVTLSLVAISPICVALLLALLLKPAHAAALQPAPSPAPAL